MIRVETDGRHINVSVLARLETPWASQLHRYANNVAREDFAFCTCATFADIVVYDARHTECPFKYPDGNDTTEYLLHHWELAEVIPESADGGHNQNDMCVEECLVEGVSNDRW